MKWQTKENGIDCGVFAMRHMETYFGGGTRSWDARFAPESVKFINLFFLEALSKIFIPYNINLTNLLELHTVHAEESTEEATNNLHLYDVIKPSKLHVSDYTG